MRFASSIDNVDLLAIHNKLRFKVETLKPFFKTEAIKPFFELKVI